MKEKKIRKKITADDLIVEKKETIVSEQVKEKVVEVEIEPKDYNFFISDEKFSVIWEQPTNLCNNTTLYQTLEIKTENCNDDEFFVLTSSKWNFSQIDDLIHILNEFKKKYDIMKNS
jgi:hypothetical protein